MGTNAVYWMRRDSATTRPTATNWDPLGPGYHEVGKYNRSPLEDRSPVEVPSTPRPQLAPRRDRYIYFSGSSEVPEGTAVNIRRPSYKIVAGVELGSSEAERVLREPSSITKQDQEGRRAAPLSQLIVLEPGAAWGMIVSTSHEPEESAEVDRSFPGNGLDSGRLFHNGV